MAGAIAGAAVAKSRGNNSSNNIQQTEVASRSAAEGVKLFAMTNDNVSSSNVVRNKDLDNRIIALGDNEQEVRENKEYLDNVYAKFGPFGATIDAQLLMDDILLGETITKYQKDTSKKIAELQMTDALYDELPDEDKVNILGILGGLSEKSDSKLDTDKMSNDLYNAAKSFRNYVEGDFAKSRRRAYSDILSTTALNQNGKPDFEMALKSVDKFADESITDEIEKELHKRKLKLFKIYKSFPKDAFMTDQQKLDFLAYKLYLIDIHLIRKFLNSNEYFKNNHKFERYLDNEFLGKASPLE